MPRVLMYTTAWCGFCRAARQFLTHDKGVEVVEIDVTGDHLTREQLARRTGSTAVPIIFVGDVHVGGYTALRQLDRDGRLDRLLAA